MESEIQTFTSDFVLIYFTVYLTIGTALATWTLVAMVQGWSRHHALKDIGFALLAFFLWPFLLMYIACLAWTDRANLEE